MALISALSLVAFAAACQPKAESATGPEKQVSCSTPQPHGEVWLPGGAFTMSTQPAHAEEGPSKKVPVGPFSIDKTEVSNADYAEFVAATGYITEAELAPDPALYPGVPKEQLKPAALVYVGAQSLAGGDPSGWWRIVDGANWRNPEGPGSDLKGRDRNPVVTISYKDALAYAQWRGRDLPTEAEWEYAARGGLESKRYEWGDDAPDAKRANTWQGVFPAYDAGDDGYKATTAPVGCYPANAFGLYDMTGNVWEWTSDWFANGATGAARQHLIKGGSFLCANNFCARYRPSARQGGPTDTGTSHVGFRTIKRRAS